MNISKEITHALNLLRSHCKVASFIKTMEYHDMETIGEEYLRRKCKICRNRKEKPEKDICNIRVYQYNGYIYCKCVNEDTPTNKTEIRRKIN